MDNALEKRVHVRYTPIHSAAAPLTLGKLTAADGPIQYTVQVDSMSDLGRPVGVLGLSPEAELELLQAANAGQEWSGTGITTEEDLLSANFAQGSS